MLTILAAVGACQMCVACHMHLSTAALPRWPPWSLDNHGGRMVSIGVPANMVGGCRCTLDDRLQCTLAGITAEGRRPHCTAQHSAAPHSSWPCQQQGLMRPTTPKGRQKMQAQQARQSFAWEQLHGLCANTNHGIRCMQSPGTPRQKPHPR